MKTRKKLIEVALPLEAINTASAREKSIRHGHPSTMHLWWARRPLAAARAVIFAQMVDDPSANPDLFPTEKAQEKERQRLFKIIEELVQWESTTNETVLQSARDEIWASWRRACAENVDHPHARELFDRNKLPAFHDPFAGGGALPLEAQRLGLEAYASDLNPVAVLINKAMIEIPPKFAGCPPVNPDWRGKSDAEKAMIVWRGAQALADDVRYYGKWMREEAEKRIGHLYPKVAITAEMAASRCDLRPYIGRALTVIAWIWVRTVKSPNPAFADADVPLASTFLLSTKKGREACVVPLIEEGKFRFTVEVGPPRDLARAKNGTKSARGANFLCLLSGTPIEPHYIKTEGAAGRISSRLMAIVVEGKNGRLYIEPTEQQERAAQTDGPNWRPDQEVEYDSYSGATYCVLYGLKRFGDLFTNRQLIALNTFADLIDQVREQVRQAAEESVARSDKGDYADAVTLYEAFVVNKCADYWSSVCSWNASGEKMRNTFGRQAIPMVWDYAEANPFSDSSGNWMAMVDWTWKAIATTPARGAAIAFQADAQTQVISRGKVISTDPPYYDNVPYAVISDFFYVWLRRTVRRQFPELFRTLAVPKAEELVAFAHRHGSKADADTFFLAGMTAALGGLASGSHPSFPVTIYYAFKQSETRSDGGTTSTGWETFLSAAIKAGFEIVGTWPMRTELGSRMRGVDTNALASSIILVCRPRASNAPSATRREYVAALKRELPEALHHLQAANIAPVDLAQAAIGPGMAVFTRYANVVDAAGEAMRIREALSLINEVLDESLSEQEGDFDADSRWALAWFEQHGFSDGDYGIAETLSKAKNTSVKGLEDAGILRQTRGKVRLLKPEELPDGWDPVSDSRLSAWESVHHLIRALTSGEQAASDLVRKLGGHAEVARELTYRLYVLCERRKRAAEALAYNGLVQSWPEIVRLAKEDRAPREATPQSQLFEEEE